MEATLEEQPQELPTSVSTGRDILVPYNKLFPGNGQMRKVMSGEYDEGIIELSDLIHAQGLLHRLSVTNEGEDGFGVQAGGRRNLALGYSVHIGRLSPYADIPCTEYPKDRATEISLAENSGRLESHPVDQFMAFAKLREEGRTDAQIASRHGVSMLTVERRMVLSKIAPRFIAMCRNGEATMDQLQALAMSNNHDYQNAAWESLNENRRTPYLLRKQLTFAEVEGTDRFALLVGVEAYQAAGGTVRHDLFSNEGEHFFSDGALLNQLATDKLEAVADEEREAGWLWVEVSADISDSCYYQCDHERATTAKLEGVDATGMNIVIDLIGGLDRCVDELDGAIEDAEEAESEAVQAMYAQRDALVSQRDTLDEFHAALEANLTSWKPQTLKTCGVIVSLGRTGVIEVKRGLLRPEEKKAIAKAKVEELRKKGKPIPGHLKASAPAERATFSERLMLDMTAHRTAALQAALIGDPHVALALAVHRMADLIFSNSYHQERTPLKLSTSLTRSTQLSSRATEYADSPAAAEFEKAASMWGDKLPGGDGAASTLPWFLDQDDSVLLDLLAFCTASALDAMHGRERPDYETEDALIEALDVDMADWWRPTPEKFLSGVSMAQLTEAVTEACSAEAAKPLAKMKKRDGVTFAAGKLAETRWLPVPLRRKARPA